MRAYKLFYALGWFLGGIATVESLYGSTAIATRIFANAVFFVVVAIYERRTTVTVNSHTQFGERGAKSDG